MKVKKEEPEKKAEGDIDWIAIRKDYDKAIYNNPRLAAKYGIAVSSIHKKIKKENWPKIRVSSSEKDWLKIREDYRTGRFNFQELGKKYNATPGYIRLIARRDGWKKDKITKDLILFSAESTKTREVIKKLAENTDEVIVNHKTDVVIARGVIRGLFDELNQCGVDPGRLEMALHNFANLEMLSDMTAPDKARSVQIIRSALSLGSRSKIISNLAGALNNLINLERQAYGLDTEDGDKPADHVPIEDRVKKHMKNFSNDNVTAIGDKS